jgi:hypothetical protein
LREGAQLTVAMDVSAAKRSGDRAIASREFLKKRRRVARHIS